MHYAGAPPGDTSRLCVAEQHGLIKIINLPSRTINPMPFLDISFEVGQGQGGGILGMTFDPNYATNGHFYVSYTTDTGGIYDTGVSHIAWFTVSPTDPTFTDPSTEVTVITVDQPFNDHNFDWIGFSNRSGDDGNLYICSGAGVPATGVRGMCRGATAKVTRRCLQKSCVSTSKTMVVIRSRPTISSQDSRPRLNKRFFVTACGTLSGQLRSAKWRFAVGRRGGA